MTNEELVNPPHPGKLELIERVARQIGRPWRFADLGGLWAVHGAYAFHALAQPGCAGGVLVDTHPTRTFLETLAGEPRLTFIQGNFGDADIAARAGAVEVVMLFDTLLHQVAPDWDEILHMYTRRADHVLVFNQQYTGPRTERLLELGEDAYFRNVPHDRKHPTYAELFGRLDELHPTHGRRWRDVHHIWQWGITDADLLETMRKLGFDTAYTRNWGRVHQLEHFEDHAFVFSRTGARCAARARRTFVPRAPARSAPQASLAQAACDTDLSALPDATLMRFLRETRRVLAAGGRLDIALPDDAAARARLLARMCEAGFTADAGDGPRASLVVPDRRMPAEAMPLVTIAIPAYKPQFFAECLRSAVTQTWPALDILVCDDSAGEELRRIASHIVPSERADQVTWVANPQNLGGRANFIQCIERARGEFIKFLCDDDELAPDCVERMMHAFREDASITLAFSRRLRIDEDGEALPDDKHSSPLSEHDCIFCGEELAGAVIALQANVIGEPTTVMFRKADLAWIKPHYASFAGHDDIRVVGDIAAWHNLLSQGDAAFIARPLSRFRIHPAQAQAHDRVAELVRTSWPKLEAGSHQLGFLSDPPALVRSRVAGTRDWRTDPRLPLNARLLAIAEGRPGVDERGFASEILTLLEHADEDPATPPAPSAHADADPWARYRAAASLLAGDRAEEGIEQLIAQAAADSPVAEVYEDLAEWAASRDDVASAAELLKAAVARRPEPGKASLDLAMLQASQGLFEDALATLSPYLRAHPRDADALTLVRQVLGAGPQLSAVAWARLLADLRGEQIRQEARAEALERQLRAIAALAKGRLGGERTDDIGSADGLG